MQLTPSVEYCPGEHSTTIAIKGDETTLPKQIAKEKIEPRMQLCIRGGRLLNVLIANFPLFLTRLRSRKM